MLLVLLFLFAGVLHTVAHYILRGAPSAQVRAHLRAIPAIAALYPIVCCALFLLWSNASAPANSRWDTPIFGKYHLFMINTTDSAAIYNSSIPGVFQGGVLQLPNHQDIILGVHSVAVRPPWIIGVATPNDFYNAPQRYDRPLYFLLDTRTATRTDVGSFTALQATAEKLGPPLKLERVDSVFRRNRTRIHVGFGALLLFVLPPPIAIFLLNRTVCRAKSPQPRATS